MVRRVRQRVREGVRCRVAVAGVWVLSRARSDLGRRVAVARGTQSVDADGGVQADARDRRRDKIARGRSRIAGVGTTAHQIGSYRSVGPFGIGPCGDAVFDDRLNRRGEQDSQND